jgi:hypothetical protein
LEVRGFAEANQNGWTELTIPNEVGEQHFYRLENGTWVQKNTLAEAQQPYQAPLPPPTATQLAEITWMCDQMTAVVSSVSMQDCNSTMLTVYNSNAATRANMDFLIQTNQQKQAATSQQQTASDQKLNCMKSLAKPFDPTISSAAQVYDSQVDMYTCGLGPMP